MESLSGRMIGRYRVGERLGQGGMGEVYRADDTRLRRAVALKRLPSSLSNDRAYRLRFLHGAQHAAKLNHPAVAVVHDFFEEGDELFLVMEYVEGETLDTLPAPLPVEDFLPIAVQCAKGLRAAHENGVVHQDLKPRNIMLGPERQVKLLDFGIARRLPGFAESEASSVETATEDCGGTPAYMAPEILLGQPSDHRADLFSLGVVFYELLTGSHPFPGKTAAARADQILHARPMAVRELNQGVPEALQIVVDRLLTKVPEDRFQSAAELLDNLQALHDRTARPAPAPVKLSAGRRRWPRAVLVLAPVLLALAFLSPWEWNFLGPGDDLPTRPVTVAVLPFEVSVDDPAKNAFSAGLHVSFSRRLGRVKGEELFSSVPTELVLARNIGDPSVVGLEAGAGVALVTRVTFAGGDVELQQSLLEDETGRRLRVTSFSLPYSEPMAIESQMVESAAEILGLNLSARERSRLFRFGTLNEAAYHFHLQGLGGLSGADESGRADWAIEAFRSALAMDADFGEASVGLGLALLERFRTSDDPALLEEAGKRCGLALRDNPELAEARICLARIEQKLGNDDAAFEELRAALHLAPDQYDCVRPGAKILALMDRPDEAAAAYRAAIEANPRLWLPHFDLGVLSYREGRYREAAAEFEIVTQMAPRYYRAWTNLSAAYGQLQDYQKLGASAERSKALKPSEMSYNNLATAYFYQGRFRESVETYQQAIIYLDREKRLGFTIFGNLAEALYWSPGEREKAIPHYRKALEMAEAELREDPEGARSALTLARIAGYQAALGDGGAALRSLDAALRKAPGETEILFKAAQVHMQLGDKERAADWLEKALQAGVPVANARLHPLFAPLREDPAIGSLLGEN